MSSHGAESVLVPNGLIAMVAVDILVEVRTPLQFFSALGPSRKSWPPQEPLTLPQPQFC